MNVAYFVALAACCLAFEANANLITFEPDDYASGTNISTAVDGITLLTFTYSQLSNEFNVAPVYAVTDPYCVTDPYYCAATTGTNIFMPQAEYPTATDYPDRTPSFPWEGSSNARSCFYYLMQTGTCDSPMSWTSLLMIFDNPTDYVEISGAHRPDGLYLYAFDAQGHRIFGYDSISIDRTCGAWSGYCSDATYWFGQETVHLQHSTRDVKYILAGGPSIGTSLDALRFNSYGPAASVPEPSTLALLGLGLAGLGLGRRRRTH